jgi:hypothetical protein
MDGNPRTVAMVSIRDQMVLRTVPAFRGARRYPDTHQLVKRVLTDIVASAG